MAGFREGRLAARFLPERVALLYQFDGRDVLPLVLIAGIAGFTLWGFIHPPLLASLLAWFVLMRIARAGLSVIYRRANPPAEATARWEDVYCIMAVLFGAAWGLVSVYFYASRDLFQELTVTFLISLVAFGLPASLAPSPKTFVGFMVPLATPLVGLLLARGGAVNISVAVAVDDGLITPVIRNADKLSLKEISAAVKDLAKRAREKKLKPEEYSGGTITVSNLGAYGIEQFFAIVNPPQAAILAIGAIVKKPVVNAKNEIVVGERVTISLSADHRVVDGAVGAEFLSTLRKLIENPAMMLF